MFCLLFTNAFSQARVVVNPDFELPLLPAPNSWAYVAQSTVPGWSTTSTTGMLEIWRSPFQGVVPPSGQQHMELNANQAADLYFDACMFGNETLSWSFYHRGRSGVDSARLLIGPPGAEIEVLRFGTNNNAWVQYSGGFVNTFGSTTIRFRFQPLSTATGNLTVGNFIDDVQIVGLDPIVEFEQTTYSDLESIGGNLPRLLVNGRVPAGGLTVDVLVEGGSAAAGTDYTHVVELRIPEGDYDGMTTTVDLSAILTILDDNLFEGDENISLRLANPQAPLQVNDASCNGTINDQAIYTILDDDIAMAIELSTFEVKATCEANLLSWTTATEYEHAFFAIEQSQDGIHWTAIGRVNGLGDSEIAQHYSFEHHYPTQESYYRLKSVDIYGEFEYSDVLYTEKPCMTNASAEITLYPNPVQIESVLKVNVPEAAAISSYRIIDMQGRVLKSVQLNQDMQTVIELSIDGLPSGTYQFVYSIDGIQNFKPFVIL